MAERMLNGDWMRAVFCHLGPGMHRDERSGESHSSNLSSHFSALGGV